MRDLSRAIRHELQEHGQTLQEIPTGALRDYVAILGAFHADLRDELARRSARQVEDEDHPAHDEREHDQQARH